MERRIKGSHGIQNNVDVEQRAAEDDKRRPPQCTPLGPNDSLMSRSITGTKHAPPHCQCSQDGTEENSGRREERG
jgi:hypothetical protein